LVIIISCDTNPSGPLAEAGNDELVIVFNKDSDDKSKPPGYNGYRHSWYDKESDSYRCAISTEPAKRGLGGSFYMKGGAATYIASAIMTSIVYASSLHFVTT
jgi:hypothetical protein